MVIRRTFRILLIKFGTYIHEWRAYSRSEYALRYRRYYDNPLNASGNRMSTSTSRYIGSTTGGCAPFGLLQHGGRPIGRGRPGTVLYVRPYENGPSGLAFYQNGLSPNRNPNRSGRNRTTHRFIRRYNTYSRSEYKTCYPR